MQEVLRHLSMPVPRLWWESCLNNEKHINNYACVLAEVCKELLEIKKWNDYSLFVAIAFADMDYQEPYQYSLNTYYHNARKVLKNQDEIKVLGERINNFLMKSTCIK